MPANIQHLLVSTKPFELFFDVKCRFTGVKYSFFGCRQWQVSYIELIAGIGKKWNERRFNI